MSNRSTLARFFALGAFATLAFVFISPAYAQYTGAIQGTVTDASGGAVPNATVEVKDLTHGVDRTLATDSAGIYYVPSLPVGTYSVEVKAPGLTQTETKGLIVEVGSTVTQNFALTVASSTQVVEVQAAAPVGD